MASNKTLSKAFKMNTSLDRYINKNNFKSGAKHALNVYAPQVAIKFHRWCLKKKSLESFKDHYFYKGRKYSDQELFNLFLKEEYGI